jgi:FAD/FMN-containing dehydrogenase
MNERQLQLVVERVPLRRNPLAQRHDWHVLVELSDTRKGAEMDECLQQTLEEAVGAGLVLDAVVAANDTQRAALWEVRHSVTEANKGAGVGLTTDCAVPVSAVPAFIEGAIRAVREIVPDIDIVIVGHMGDGNVHFIPMFTFDGWQGLSDATATAAALRRSVNDVAHRLGGTFSAEHGIGQTGLPEMAHYKSPVELAMMRAVKQALDPGNLMNPGRLVP